MHHRRLILASLLACSVALGAEAGTATAANLDSPSALTLVSSHKLDGRLTELTFKTPALSGTTPVRVLLPSDYATSNRHYPVLYLLHGCCNYDVSGAASWTVHGDAEALTAGLPLIVVMPDSGAGGFYSDWYNNGSGGPPMYETYDIDELVPWIDEHYRTLPDRAGRVLAGLSMGGYGAMELAARHPDMFVAAASFSGAVDNMDPDFGGADAAFPALDGQMPASVWGPQQTQEVLWRGHNPVDLADNLRGLNLTIRTGNDQPGGPYNPVGSSSGVVDPIETGVHHESQLLEQTLNNLGIPSTDQDYGPGNHGWPYWSRDLKLTLPTLMATLAHPPAAPAEVTYTSIEPKYSAFGWTVSLKRTVTEFSTLMEASPHGFTLSGTGTATVTTPADYIPGATYGVTTAGEAGSATSRVVAAADGRLTLPVPLGPDNTYQEFTPQAQLVGESFDHATVTIAGQYLGSHVERSRGGRRNRRARHRARSRHRTHRT